MPTAPQKIEAKKGVSMLNIFIISKFLVKLPSSCLNFKEYEELKEEYI